MWPLPQRPGLANNFVANPIKRSSLHRGDGRLDHQLIAEGYALLPLLGRLERSDHSRHVRSQHRRQRGQLCRRRRREGAKHGGSAGLTRSHPARSAIFAMATRSSTCHCCRPTLSNPLWNTIPGRQTERSVSAVGAHRGHHRLCGSGQRTFDAADSRSEDARDGGATSPR